MQDQRRINDEDLDGGERELRDALASLRPARPAIDVTAIAVAAARAAERRRLWFWRMATGALAACLALVLLLHRAERPVDRLVIGTGNPAPHPTDIVLRRGLSGLIPPLSLVKDAGRVTTSAPELTPLAGPTLQTGTAGPIPRLLKLIEKGA
jgi:hypothetical protein